jgi:hypothetical protein
MLLRLFQYQVRDQCRFVLIAAQDLNDALKAGNSPEPLSWRERQEVHDRIWYSLQNLLTAAANIAKALWGEGAKLTEERRPLRESLGVPDDSPLQQTALRNHFEHFDSRLDIWAAESATTPGSSYIDKIIGPPTTVVAVGSGPKEYFRHFDPSTGVASFWGETFDLKALVDTVVELLPRAEAESAKPDNDSGNGQ